MSCPSGPLLVCLFLALPAGAQTVDEIVARNLEARGGLSRLQAVQTVRMIGLAPQGAQARSMMGETPTPGVAVMVLEAKRPNLVRNTWRSSGLTEPEYRLAMRDGADPTGSSAATRERLLEELLRSDLSGPGLSIVNAFDGTTAWSYDSQQRKVVATPIGTPSSGFALDGMLLDFRARGFHVERVGKARAEGKNCHTLLLRTKAGDAYTIYIDEATHLEVVVEAKTRHSPFIVRTVYDDWKAVGGVMIPHTTVTSGAEGPGQRLTIDRVELNVPMDDGRFAPPAVAR